MHPSRSRFWTAHPRRRLLLSLGLAAALPRWGRAAPSVTVAAAADLKFALEELARLFEPRAGHAVRLVFGSSGQLYTQILQGAPFHLFLSADEAFVLQLAEAGKTLDRGRLYAYGRIGILVPKGSPLKADGELKDLAAALRDGRVRKFAIANPQHAPYGQRAREALQRAGVWAAIEPKLVYGENIAQTAQFALSGAADGGIVALSLARAPQVAAQGDFGLIPADWHRPLAQRMVLLNGAPQAAHHFHDYLISAQARAVLARHGFELPRP